MALKLNGVHLCVRWGSPADMDSVLEIQNLSYAYPASMEDLGEGLKFPSAVLLVAELRRKWSLSPNVLGYAILIRKRYRAKLVSIAVHPDRRRIGIGTAIIDDIKSSLAMDRRRHISAYVDEINLEAQLFFRSQGFEAQSICRGSSRDPESRRDMYYMKYRDQVLAQASSNQATRT